MKKKYQGMGVGRILFSRFNDVIEKEYFIMKVIVQKNNKKALYLYKDGNYHIVKEDDEFFYMIRMAKYSFLQPIVVPLFKLIFRVSFAIKYKLFTFWRE